MNVLDHVIRKDLDNRARRIFALMDPVKVIIDNVDDKFCEKVLAPLFPKDKTKGEYEMLFTKEFLVDRSDIRLEDHKDFYAFAPNKVVGLKYATPVKVNKIITDDKGNITQMHVNLEKDSGVKPKTFVNWISTKEAVNCTVNLYDVLFTADDPNSMDDWISGLNPNSLTIKPNAKVHKSILGIYFFSYLMILRSENF
jgi:glutaminyl-tRNA synthetase